MQPVNVYFVDKCESLWSRHADCSWCNLLSGKMVPNIIGDSVGELAPRLSLQGITFWGKWEAHS